jgi:hypothetical protein
MTIGCSCGVGEYGDEVGSMMLEAALKRRSILSRTAML